MSGQRWAYTGAMLGALLSIGANIAHALTPPAGAADDWTPQPGAVALASAWPVLVLVAVEILIRVQWPTGARWTAVQWVGLLPVAAVAAIVSYRHMSGLMLSYGEDPVTAHLGPIGIDGLMVISAAALVAAAPGERPVSAPVPGERIPGERTAERPVTDRERVAERITSVRAPIPRERPVSVSERAAERVSERTAERVAWVREHDASVAQIIRQWHVSRATAQRYRKSASLIHH
jgi:hypothetical protein